MLEIKNLTVSIEDKLILDGLQSDCQRGRGCGDHGSERLRQVDACLCVGGQAGLHVTSGEILLDGENLLELEPTERALKGCFWRSSIRPKFQASRR